MRPAAATSRSLRHAAQIVGAALVALTFVACSGSTDDADEAKPTTTTSASSDLTLNELQLIGTHNSYHVAPEPALFAAEKAVADSIGPDAGGLGDIAELNYTHAPLPTQLERGIRSFELDVWADPEGGLFADPKAPKLLNVPVAPLQGMDQPGFKVLHIVDIDFVSTCPTFVACLTELKTWSDANPEHVPIIVNVELKDEPLPEPLNVTPVVTIDGAQMDALDAEIRSVFDEDQLLTPDDVRGDAATLREAVTNNGWPKVDDVRGQVMFFMDNAGRHRDEYLAGHPSLEGRVLFTSSAGENDDDRAVVKLNDPGDGSEIREVVRAGYLVRTRSDSGLTPDEVGDEVTAIRDVALGSGAQIVSTDYPKGEEANGFVVTFGTPVEARCNAVLVRRCPAGALEP